MIINSANLASLRVGYNAAMKAGMGQAKPQWDRVATRVTSTTKEQKYGWLNKLPSVREWIGARVVQNISESDYAIKERPWEQTFGVDRDDIETDNLGIYTMMFQSMGESAAAFPDQLIWALLKAGFSTNCYDGQFFFDTDHPVIAADGATVTSVANTDGGAGTPWFLLDTTRFIKPLLLQVRRDFGDIVAKDKVTDDNVFDLNEFQYGMDARMNAGYGFWQMAWGSKQTLNAANYEVARVGMGSFTGDHGRPLGIVPNLLVVPPSLEGAGRSIIQSQLINGGESNKWAGTAELLVVPWLV